MVHPCCVTAQRDPASVWLDRGAQDLLRRAYAAERGSWVGTRLADPGPRMRAWLAAEGIDWRGPDNPSTRGGRGLNARDRWMRAFVRSLYYNHRWFTGGGGVQADRRLVGHKADALEVDIGRRLVPRGIVPGGRAVRVRVRQGGRSAYQAARKLPDRDRVFDNAGEPADRFSEIGLRDWQ
jgi:hypothetical protein